jgi:hypothetical protein
MRSLGTPGDTYTVQYSRVRTIHLRREPRPHQVQRVPARDSGNRISALSSLNAPKPISMRYNL